MLARQLPQAFEIAKEMVRFGQETSDNQAAAWGLFHEGLLKQQTGEIEEAIRLFHTTAELCLSIPDYQTLASIVANLGKSYMIQGNIHEALSQIQESQRIIKELLIGAPPKRVINFRCA